MDLSEEEDKTEKVFRSSLKVLDLLVLVVLGGPGPLVLVGLRFLHGGGLAGPVVSQEGGDLAVVELEGQSVHSQLVAVAVDLDQVLDVDAGLDVGRLLLDADCWFIDNRVPFIRTTTTTTRSKKVTVN